MRTLLASTTFFPIFTSKKVSDTLTKQYKEMLVKEIIKMNSIRVKLIAKILSQN